MCFDDDFIRDGLAEASPIQIQSTRYEQLDAPKFFQIKTILDQFGDEVDEENEWERNVWSPALTRLSDISKNDNWLLYVKWVLALTFIFFADVTLGLSH
jgi:hypothetical protein